MKKKVICIFMNITHELKNLNVSKENKCSNPFRVDNSTRLPIKHVVLSPLLIPLRNFSLKNVLPIHPSWKCFPLCQFSKTLDVSFNFAPSSFCERPFHRGSILKKRQKQAICSQISRLSNKEGDLNLSEHVIAQDCHV